MEFPASNGLPGQQHPPQEDDEYNSELFKSDEFRHAGWEGLEREFHDGPARRGVPAARPLLFRPPHRCLSAWPAAPPPAPPALLTFPSPPALPCRLW